MVSMYCTVCTVLRVRLIELLEAQAEVDNHRDEESAAKRRRAVHVVVIDRTAFPTLQEKRWSAGET